VFMTVPPQAVNSGVASTVLTRVTTRGTEQDGVMSLGTLSFCCLYHLWFVFGTSFLCATPVGTAEDRVPRAKSFSNCGSVPVGRSLIEGSLKYQLFTLGVTEGCVAVWVGERVRPSEGQSCHHRQGSTGPTTACSHRPNTSHKAHCDSLQYGPRHLCADVTEESR